MLASQLPCFNQTITIMKEAWKLYCSFPKIDADSNDGKIHSRIGLTAEAHSVDSDFNFFNFVSQEKIKKPLAAF